MLLGLVGWLFGWNAMRCIVECFMNYPELTLPIHARITYTFSWVYFEQIEQIRQEQDKIKSHGSVEIKVITVQSIVSGLFKI